MMFPGWVPPAQDMQCTLPFAPPKPEQLLGLAMLGRTENHKSLYVQYLMHSPPIVFPSFLNAKSRPPEDAPELLRGGQVVYYSSVLRADVCNLSTHSSLREV